MEQKSRIIWIDNLRCIAMFICVMGHVYMGTTPDTLRYYIYSFHMPLFFAISGASYYLQTKNREYTFLGMLENKSRGILWPYFVFSMLNIPMLIIMDYIRLGYSHKDVSELIEATFYGNLGYKSMPTGPLWFCLVLFLATILFYLIRKFCKSDLATAVVTVVIGFSGYLITSYFSSIVYPWYSNVTFIAVIFFMLGYMFMKHISSVQAVLGGIGRQAVWMILFAVAGYLCARYNTKISMAMSSYGSFALFFGSVIGFSGVLYLVSVHMPGSRLVAMVGRNTIVYLGLHKNLANYFFLYSERTNTFATEHPFIVSVLIFVVLMPVTYVFEKYFPFLLGKKIRRSEGGEMQQKDTAPSASGGRLEWIDVLKCIGMLLVVVGHASDSGSSDSYRYYIYSFHMPLFFIISGMTFYLQCRKRTFDFMGLVKNKAKGLVWPYFTLSFLTLPIWVLNFKILTDSDRSVLGQIYGIFYSHQHHVSGPSNALWFCLTLFLTLIVFWLVNEWSEHNEKILTLAVMIIGSFGYAMSVRGYDFYTPWHIETVPIALVCVLAGWLFIKHLDFFMNLLGGKKRQILWCIILLPSAYFCAKYNVKISMAVNTYGSFMLFAGAVVGFSVICVIIARATPCLGVFKLIGRNTIVMLAFHAPIFRFLERASEVTARFIENEPIITGVLVFIALIPVCYLFERWLPFLIGRSRRKPVKA
ncbi:MAG TPA: acyltransferase family protein [Candidatus Mediterraneibacter pullistercoris]|nr:acyltransferase family protein [Candidatus Mediterraneibacter pullistercoris]